MLNTFTTIPSLMLIFLAGLQDIPKSVYEAASIDGASPFYILRRIIVPLLNELPGVTCVDPGGAFYAFPNITGRGRISKELQNLMLEKAGVATVAGTSFGVHGEGYVRFSYANSAENIRKAIERVGDILAG